MFPYLQKKKAAMNAPHLCILCKDKTPLFLHFPIAKGGARTIAEKKLNFLRLSNMACLFI
jgi:hypothetical protein